MEYDYSYGKWKRLQSVFAHCNMAPLMFAKHIGLPSADTLFQIKRGNYGISMRLADRIVALHPEIDRHWLLTGEGMMLRKDCGECASAAEAAE